jgi:hypothetical protein
VALATVAVLGQAFTLANKAAVLLISLGDHPALTSRAG